MRCSTICVTVSSSVFAEAPGYVVVTATVGGAMAGYCDTGKDRIEIAPAIITMMAMTHAKMGRSMKNLATRAPGIEGARPSARRLPRVRRGHGLHLDAGADLLQALHDD